MFDPESPLAPAKTKDGAFFMDRDPDTFAVILAYLQTGHIRKSSYNILDQLMQEADFFQLEGLKAKINEIVIGGCVRWDQKVGLYIEI
eukprot:TRINITY_DN22379_c1_g1_i1.p1 TRINITY_DN22379_c1_g1~~TRINITY_DN22379_c1_g1_i1.p1  ORF type:complete len:102 (-),score=28.23 TRINITY_DN22379_c1_g1_i1:1-264(-)